MSSDWTVVWQAVTGLSLACMAFLQVVVALGLLKVMREAREMAAQVRGQLDPLARRSADALDHAERLMHQVQGAVADASEQVGRVRGTMDAVANGVSHVRGGARRVARESAGIVAGARAAWSTLRRDSRDRRPHYPLAASWEQLE